VTEEVWLSLVDEPIAAIVAELEGEDPALRALTDSPDRLLAFRTFASIRVGMVLGRLLMEREVDAAEGSATWVDELLCEPAVRAEVADEVHAVAKELSEAAAVEALGPDEATRERFRAFARRELSD
jgi:hypothetical protein